MQLFTYIFTDFIGFRTPGTEMWLAPHELSEFASLLAREMLSTVPDLVHKGMCVAIYDGDGATVSLAPLDTVH